jgi:hypothetical protein
MNKEKKYSTNFGKYGLLNLSDVFTRKLEFNAWMNEIKNISTKDLTPEKEKSYLEEFIKSYNNAEFSSKKFYDMVKFQASAVHKMLRRKRKEMDKLLSNKDSNFMLNDKGYVFDDEAQKEREKKIYKEIEQRRRLEDAVKDMNKSKADAMKEIDYKGNLMRHLYQTGDVTGAKDIYETHFNIKKEKEKKENMPSYDDEE